MIGKSIKIFDELDSTNNFVKMNVSNLDHGTIVVSKKQTNGRGRRENKWVSEEGNLYFSIVLKSNISRNNIFKYIVQSSIAIIRTLNNYDMSTLIKYPNDCLVGGKKISGVLIESSGSNRLEYIIVGIGININQINFGELNDKATSMKLNLKKDFDTIDILNEFIKNYNVVLDCNHDSVFEEYLSSSVVLNKTIRYRDEDYIIHSIEQDGTIVIKNSIGELRVAYGEISLKELY